MHSLVFAALSLRLTESLHATTRLRASSPTASTVRLVTASLGRLRREARRCAAGWDSRHGALLARVCAADGCLAALGLDSGLPRDRRRSSSEKQECNSHAYEKLQPDKKQKMHSEDRPSASRLDGLTPIGRPRADCALTQLVPISASSLMTPFTFDCKLPAHACRLTRAPAGHYEVMRVERAHRLEHFFP